MSEDLRPSRYPSRASQNINMINQALDSGLFCTVAFVRDGVAHQIPTGYCRIEDKVYIHASVKSGFMESIVGQRVSFSVTHMDALVLAPTAFDHSFNYRSVIGFSDAVKVTDEKKKMEIFMAFTDRYLPGRIADLGEPTPDQVRITSIVELDLNHCAIKLREGESNTENPLKYGKWVGQIPVITSYGDPIPDKEIEGKIEFPDYLVDLKMN